MVFWIALDLIKTTYILYSGVVRFWGLKEGLSSPREKPAVILLDRQWPLVTGLRPVVVGSQVEIWTKDARKKEQRPSIYSLPPRHRCNDHPPLKWEKSTFPAFKYIHRHQHQSLAFSDDLAPPCILPWTSQDGNQENPCNENKKAMKSHMLKGLPISWGFDIHFFLHSIAFSPNHIDRSI